MPGTIATALQIDAEAVVESIIASMRHHLADTFRRKGFVVGMSSGVDSSVCAALAVRAVGKDRVFGLFLPEHESDPASLQLATELADQLGIQHTKEDIAPLLEGAACYRRRNDAIRRVVPEFRDDWGCKLSLPADRLETERINVTYIVVQPPGGEMRRIRLPAAEYREIVAASNFKQRARAMMEYFHADRLHYAVIGTPNRLEYDQGFFVKGGDGLADIKPIAHLFKTQVYALADYLGVPKSITSRPPTTDTFSLPQSQEEFYYLLPTKTLDKVMYAHDAGLEPEAVAEEIGLTPDQVRAAYRDVVQKRSTTRYLHLGPQLVEHVDLGWTDGNGAHA
ncbi:MAG TPA: NAD(+) synthase [Gemmatimonadaceae bacterium]|nr:NAD(+) synthase [Gemmatimonadaceae bacterium]